MIYLRTSCDEVYDCGDQDSYIRTPSNNKRPARGARIIANIGYVKLNMGDKEYVKQDEQTTCFQDREGIIYGGYLPRSTSPRQDSDKTIEFEDCTDRNAQESSTRLSD